MAARKKAKKKTTKKPRTNRDLATKYGSTMGTANERLSNTAAGRKKASKVKRKAPSDRPVAGLSDQEAKRQRVVGPAAQMAYRQEQARKRSALRKKLTKNAKRGKRR